MRKNKKKKAVVCPYCGNKAIMREGSFIHGAQSVIEHLYVCASYPQCDAYVSVHRNSKEPMGTLADKKLRCKRIEAHRIFGRLIELGIFSKQMAYQWLSDSFSLNANQAHIGNFNEFMCSRLISEASRVIENNQWKVDGKNEPQKYEVG